MSQQPKRSSASSRDAPRVNLRAWLTVDAGQFNFGPRAAPIVTPHEKQPTFVAPPARRLGEWLAKYRPEFDWTAPHFRLMQSTLDEITFGELRRLIISISIRHGKTETITSYAAERIQLDPKLQVLAGAGVASVNAGLILIDDPIGSRDEAESLAERDRVFDWITSDILARCVPTTAVIISHPRWHVDDPIGRLRDRQAGRWRVIDLPGRAEANDPLGRSPGEPLWPQERGEEWLNNMRADLLEYGFASLVQGRPRPREGGMFKWTWWQLLPQVPLAGTMVRYWDLAGTEAKGKGHDPDYSAGALLCRMPDLRTAIVDVARFQKSIAARDAELEKICKSDLTSYRGRVSWWIETEAGIAGAERTSALVRRLQALGMTVHTEHPTGKKVHRAEPLASAAEAGNVVLCPGEWRDPFRSEAADFPNGKHDDQIDAAAGAFAKLSFAVGAWGNSSFKA
jgi:predicted phage terminase large subunit-like protein